jgi:endoplasmic reticulum lectin 1
LGGEKIAMFGVKYTDGTPCEVLTDTNREITVFYACDENGNDNIASFEEISSCIYEMIVVTKWICSHPAYKIPEKTQQSISCFSVDDSPVRPESLVDIELEQNTQKLEENKIKMTNRQGETIIVHYKTIDDNNDQDTDDETLNPRDLNFQFIQTEQQMQQPQQQQQSQELTTNQPQPHTIGDEAQKEMINAFLSGSECLTGGGAGWWKYEVCLFKHVIQFHQDDKTKKRTVILLGEWNNENHVEWLNKNPGKRPFKDKHLRQTVSHLYTNGDFCELTNKKRIVEVKFKCIVTKEKSHAISLYLVEHSTCEYLLAIESPWLCDFVNTVDEVNGLDNGSSKELKKEQEIENPNGP